MFAVYLYRTAATSSMGIPAMNSKKASSDVRAHIVLSCASKPAGVSPSRSVGTVAREGCCASIATSESDPGIRHPEGADFHCCPCNLGHPLCFISLRSINLRPDLLRQSSLKYIANAKIVASCCHLTGRPHSHPCERYASSQPCVVAVLAHHRAQDLQFTLFTTTTNW